MPTVALVSGVKIQFFAAEHPPPHFHAELAENRIAIEIATLRILKGELLRNKLQDVLSWAATRKPQLLAAWEAVAAKRNPEKIG